MLWWPLGHDDQGIGRKAFGGGEWWYEEVRAKVYLFHSAQHRGERTISLMQCTAQGVKRPMSHKDVGHRNKPMG